MGGDHTTVVEVKRGARASPFHKNDEAASYSSFARRRGFGPLGREGRRWPLLFSFM